MGHKPSRWTPMWWYHRHLRGVPCKTWQPVVIAWDTGHEPRLKNMRQWHDQGPNGEEWMTPEDISTTPYHTSKDFRWTKRSSSQVSVMRLRHAHRESISTTCNLLKSAPTTHCFKEESGNEQVSKMRLAATFEESGGTGCRALMDITKETEYMRGLMSTKRGSYDNRVGIQWGVRPHVYKHTDTHWVMCKNATVLICFRKTWVPKY